MGTIKHRNGKDQTETEEIKKRWKNTQNCTIKGLNNPENRNDMVTDLEPDILECEVKWTLLGSVTTNKANGGDLIPAELFQILKDDAGKALYQYVTKFGKLSGDHRTKRGQFSFQPQRRAVSKNVQTTIQLCSFHMLAKKCSKSFKLGFSSM